MLKKIKNERWHWSLYPKYWDPSYDDDDEQNLQPDEAATASSVEQKTNAHDDDDDDDDDDDEDYSRSPGMTLRRGDSRRKTDSQRN